MTCFAAAPIAMEEAAPAHTSWPPPWLNRTMHPVNTYVSLPARQVLLAEQNCIIIISSSSSCWSHLSARHHACCEAICELLSVEVLANEDQLTHPLLIWLPGSPCTLSTAGELEQHVHTLENMPGGKEAAAAGTSLSIPFSSFTVPHKGCLHRCGQCD